MGLPVPLCSFKEHELAVQVQKPFDPQQPGRVTSPLAGARASFGGVARGSVGPASIAATAASAGTVAGRPGSGAKSQISGMSAVSAAKSKTSLASAITAGTILAKDKLAQVSALCHWLAAARFAHQPTMLCCVAAVADLFMHLHVQECSCTSSLCPL
jgi:hypothetical protein